MDILCAELEEEAVLLNEIAALSSSKDLLHVRVAIVHAKLGDSHPTIFKHISCIKTEVEVKLALLAIGEACRICCCSKVVLALFKLC